MVVQHIRISKVIAILSDLEYHIQKVFSDFSPEDKVIVEIEYVNALQPIWNKYYEMKNTEFQEKVRNIY
jgi:hypothetical protein